MNIEFILRIIFLVIWLMFVLFLRFVEDCNEVSDLVLWVFFSKCPLP